MKKYIALIAGLVLGLGVALMPPAQAQFINRITGPGVLDAGGAQKSDNDGELNTYSATSVGLVPAASATDVACLIGSATKTVRVTRVAVSGTAGTLVTLPVLITKHLSLDTSLTPVIGATAPVAVRHDGTTAAATATPTAWTNAVTLQDLLTVYAQTLTVPVTSAGTSSSTLLATWGGRGGSRAPVIRGVNQSVCVHFNGVSISSGLMNIHFEWTEE